MSLTVERQRVDTSAERSGQMAPNRPDDSQGKLPERPKRSFGKWILLALLLAAGSGLVALAFAVLVGDMNGPDPTLVYYSVTRGDLAITVTERGNLESQSNEDIICQVDDVEGDGVHGTPILWLIPNGSSVKKGDLLVELDTSNHRERLDRQVVDTEKARAEQIQAEVKYENQKTQNITAEAEAELLVQLAELELEMFEDQEKGTHRLELEEMDRLIEDINNQILAAKATMKLKKHDLDSTQSLFDLGYRGESELDRSRLEYLQAESQYAATVNKLRTQNATRDKKVSYERQMQMLKLQGALDTAKRGLIQVRRDNQALLDQAKAASELADESFKKETELFARYGEQLAACKMVAPLDGMVAYAVPSHRWHAEVRQGAPAQPKQKLISLPNLQQMQVQTAVHESVLDQVRIGLRATIRVDAFPNRSYEGTVQSVAVLPNQEGWMTSDTKIYDTTVIIDEEVQQLKPGMTAVVEIHVDLLEDVLSVPVQAVVQVENDSWCYVESHGKIERRLLTLGRTNDKFVEIRKGLSQGDQVVLNPMAIVDESELQRKSEREKTATASDKKTSPDQDKPPERQKRRRESAPDEGA